MAGVSFDLLFGAVLFLFLVWGTGRLFRFFRLPRILGELIAGIVLGPNFLDVVPFASDGRCDTVLFDREDDAGSSSESGERMLSDLHGRMLAGTVDCQSQMLWTPRWTGNELHTPDIWSFAGTIGVTLLIMESGMHINFEKVKQIGGKALIVAILGTAMPLIMGMLLVAALYGTDRMYPDGFAAGCALAPTSVGISIQLLSEAKMLNSMAGQTTLTAAFIDDVFSLILLVLLSSLGSACSESGSGESGGGGAGDAAIIVVKTIAAFAFLGVGVVGGKKVYPLLDGTLSRIPHVRGASIQPRDEVHLVIMLSSLVAFAYIGSLIGSHLLGAFVAGMCFVNVPRSHQVWVTQFKRVIRWLIRIFFACTVGFAVPVKEMGDPEAISKGLVLGLVPGILCKVFSGLPARRPWGSLGERKRAEQASLFTRFNLVQPIQYLVGMAMVARGEFAFLVAYSARNMDYCDDNQPATMVSADVYASLTWALVWALIFAPFLFKWALAVYQKASPVQRGVSIGGVQSAERNFVIQVVGQHHSGVLHEILNAIHGEGMDVLECRVETDGEVDTNYFVVQSRGKQKDFDDEKLEDIRHHITEILGDANAVVMFEAIEDEDFAFAAIEVQVVTDSATRDTHVMSQVTQRLQQLGFDVEEIDEQHRTQIDHGHETEMERDLIYAVPSKTSDEGTDISHRRVHQTKKALQSTLRDLEIKAEVVVKPVADRSKGFSELQTFDPQTAIARAKGSVWELLCFGPHDVELLSTAVRKLEPLGLRLLHAAHSHADDSEGAQQQCSRFFVEKLGESQIGSDDQVTVFSKKVMSVLMETYKSTDDTKFIVRPVDPTSLQEMSENARTSHRGLVPGLQDVTGTPDFAQQRRSSLVTGLKQIPEQPIRPAPAATSKSAMLWGLERDFEGELVAQEAAQEARGTRKGSAGAAGGRVEDLEQKVAALETLAARVGRLEELELLAARSRGKTVTVVEPGASGKTSSLGYPMGGAATSPVFPPEAPPLSQGDVILQLPPTKAKRVPSPKRASMPNMVAHQPKSGPTSPVNRPTSPVGPPPKTSSLFDGGQVNVTVIDDATKPMVELESAPPATPPAKTALSPSSETNKNPDEDGVAPGGV